MTRWIAVLIGTALISAQDGAARKEEIRKAVTSSLEKTMAKGGRIFTGRMEVMEPKAEGMTFDIADPNAGPQVEGDFSARVGADGTTVVAFENKGYRFELFTRGERRAHRLSWTGTGVPVIGDAANDLHRLLQWAPLLKSAAKAKGIEARPDAEIGGAACRVYLCPLPADLLDPGPPRKEEHPPALEVHSIEATFSVGKEDGLIRQVDVEVSRKMNLAFGGGGEDILVRSVYRFTIGSFEPALAVEVPADLQKLLK